MSTKLLLMHALENKKVSHFKGNDLTLCHCHYQNYDDYEKGHIPGAISLDSLLLESPETWNRCSAEELKNTLEQLGITHDTTVVVYGRFSFPNNDDPFPGSSAGHLGAIRCALIMMYAGVKDVKILNGGIQSWEDEGYRLTSKPFVAEAVKDFGVKFRQIQKSLLILLKQKNIWKIHTQIWFQ